MDFKGQIAMVTGGGRGIGREIALTLAREGVNIVIGDVEMESAEKTKDEIQTLNVMASAIKLNVASSEDVVKAFEGIMKELGRLDILINNAGITRDSLLLRMKEEDWDAVLNVNLKGVFLCSKEAVKLMSKQRYGRIINISSVVAFMGNPGQANYSASKSGIIGLTKTLAREYAGRGITVNAVAPGFIQTQMTDSLRKDIKEEMLKSIPLQRFGTPEEVAHVVRFLASPQSGYITGQVIHINGGMFM